MFYDWSWVPEVVKAWSRIADCILRCRYICGTEACATISFYIAYVSLDFYIVFDVNHVTCSTDFGIFRLTFQLNRLLKSFVSVVPLLGLPTCRRTFTFYRDSSSSSIFIFRPLPPSSLNRIQPKLVTCSEVSAI